MFSLRSPNVVLPLIGRCLHVVPILPSCCSYVFLKFFSRCRHVVLMSSSRSLNFVLALKGRCLHVVPTFLSHSSLIAVTLSPRFPQILLSLSSVVATLCPCSLHVVPMLYFLAWRSVSFCCPHIAFWFSPHSLCILLSLSSRCLHVVFTLSPCYPFSLAKSKSSIYFSLKILNQWKNPETE